MTPNAPNDPENFPWVYYMILCHVGPHWGHLGQGHRIIQIRVLYGSVFNNVEGGVSDKVTY